MKCPNCDGYGFTSEHHPYYHDANGNCMGHCPICVECERCQGTGQIDEEVKIDEEENE